MINVSLQICKLRIYLHLLKQSLMKNAIFVQWIVFKRSLVRNIVQHNLNINIKITFCKSKNYKKQEFKKLDKKKTTDVFLTLKSMTYFFHSCIYSRKHLFLLLISLKGGGWWVMLEGDI